MRTENSPYRKINISIAKLYNIYNWLQNSCADKFITNELKSCLVVIISYFCFIALKKLCTCIKSIFSNRVLKKFTFFNNIFDCIL